MELQNTVKEALNALYHHPDDAVRMQADRWLQDFQRTIDAWQVLTQLSLIIVVSIFLNSITWALILSKVGFGFSIFEYEMAELVKKIRFLSKG